MSHRLLNDRLINDLKYAMFCKKAIDRGPYLFYDNNFGHSIGQYGVLGKKAGLSSRDYFCETNESACYHRERCDIQEHDEIQNITRRDGSYIEELQRISTGLISILNEAKQSPLQMKACRGFCESTSLNDQIQPQHHYLKECLQEQTYRRQSSNTDRTANYDEYCARKLTTQQNLASLTTTRPVAANDASQMHMTETSNDRIETTSKIRGKFSTKGFNKMESDLSKARSRQKKETHNQIEKKRRNFINTRIIELRDLLPEHIDRATCIKKGSILKESIEYIKQLKDNKERIKILLDRINEADTKVKQLTEKLEQLESQIPNNASKHNIVDIMEPEMIEKSNFIKVSVQDDSISREDLYLSPQSPPSKIPTTVIVGQDINQMWVDLSAALTSASKTCYPVCSDIGNAEMDCCNLA